MTGYFLSSAIISVVNVVWFYTCTTKQNKFKGAVIGFVLGFVWPIELAMILGVSYWLIRSRKYREISSGELLAIHRGAGQRINRVSHEDQLWGTSQS